MQGKIALPRSHTMLGMKRCLSVLLVVLTVPLGAASADFPLTRKTHVFKKVGDGSIHADVYRPADDKIRPVVVWLHGGALVSGSRTSVPKQLLDLCQAEGFVLVSFDYRLAPEVKIPEIIADVQDAFRWLRSSADQLRIDPKRLVVTGGSAGGYLTLMTGFRVEPRPTALVAYWGYGDVDGEWYRKPSPFYRMRPLVSKEEAYAGIGKAVSTGPAPNSPEQKARGRYYLYLRQNGLWTKEVTGFEPTDKKNLDPFCPVRNVTSKFPPTLMIHGTKDNDVPFELSVNMAKEFARHNVPHELIALEGADHGLAGGDKQAIADAHKKAAAFIKKYLD